MAPRPSPQTERLVCLVDAIAARPEEGLTLSEIARHLAVTPATCHPMLASLTALGWLIRHPTRRTYRLGPALITVGRAAARGLGVLDVARPVLDRLSADLALTVLALGPGEHHVTVADIVRGPRAAERHLRVGDQIPIAPPLGVGYVCWADEQTVRRWLDGAGADPTTRRHLGEAVVAARERGYTVELVTPLEAELGRTLADLDVELEAGPAARIRTLIERTADELPAPNHADAAQIGALDPERAYAVGRVAAPVTAPSGEPALILALHGFPERITGADLDKIGRRLVEAAHDISARLTR